MLRHPSAARATTLHWIVFVAADLRSTALLFAGERDTLHCVQVESEHLFETNRKTRKIGFSLALRFLPPSQAPDLILNPPDWSKSVWGIMFLIWWIEQKPKHGFSDARFGLPASFSSG